ncbi:MAG: putative membrane protein insertion efficiency factor [Candidatus Anoxychlamydiales bacterium]|nr:putative membrane protein insertion efficiency factor [Candidatus Anoxychlamydiales bacterium]NGX35664.1 putative membrane protein insertion efficiency factor [Candidatus Anoxychlamydiales bacterium]
MSLFKIKKLSFIFLLVPCFIFAKAGYFEPWGKDATMLKRPIKKEVNKKATIAGKIANKVIGFHQKFISPASGPRSNFRPTSSKYMELAIKRYGFLKGFTMGCDRLLRENSDPWVYKKIVIDNVEYKFDPAFEEKHITLR